MTSITAQANRTQLVASIRALADTIESIDTMEFSPYAAVGYTHYLSDASLVRAVMAQFPGGWEKHNAPTASYITYEKSFKDSEGRARAYLSFEVSKGATCKRIQIDTRHVEAVPAHDEPVYGWDCGDSSDDLPVTGAVSDLPYSAQF